MAEPTSFPDVFNTGRTKVTGINKPNTQFTKLPALNTNFNSSQQLGDAFNPSPNLSYGGATPTSYGIPALSNVGDSSITPDFSSMDYGSDPLTQDFSTPSIGGDGKTGFDLWGKGGRNIGAAMQGLGSLGSALSAYKMYKVGKQTLDQNKQAFNLNAANQAKITNAQIQDQARYNAANRNKSLAGDFAAIDLASQKEYNERKISGQGIA